MRAGWGQRVFYYLLDINIGHCYLHFLESSSPTLSLPSSVHDKNRKYGVSTRYLPLNGNKWTGRECACICRLGCTLIARALGACSGLDEPGVGAAPITTGGILNECPLISGLPRLLVRTLDGSLPELVPAVTGTPAPFAEVTTGLSPVFENALERGLVLLCFAPITNLLETCCILSAVRQ